MGSASEFVRKIFLTDDMMFSTSRHMTIIFVNILYTTEYIPFFLRRYIVLEGLSANKNVEPGRFFSDSF